MIIPKDAEIREIAAMEKQPNWKKGELARVAGWPFVLEGCEGVQFFIDERMLVYLDEDEEDSTVNDKDFEAEGFTRWYITELSTGMLASIGDSRAEAEANLVSRFAKIGKQGVLDAIEKGKNILREAQ